MSSTSLRYINPQDCAGVIPRRDPYANPDDTEAKTITPNFICADSPYGGRECQETSLKPGQVPGVTVYSGKNGCIQCTSACAPFVSPDSPVVKDGKDTDRPYITTGDIISSINHASTMNKVSIGIGIGALVALVLYAMSRRNKKNM